MKYQLNDRVVYGNKGSFSIVWINENNSSTPQLYLMHGLAYLIENKGLLYFVSEQEITLDVMFAFSVEETLEIIKGLQRAVEEAQN